MIVMIYYSGSDINLPQKNIINCQKLLRRGLYYRVTHLHFGTPGGKIDVSMYFCSVVYWTFTWLIRHVRTHRKSQFIRRNFTAIFCVYGETYL